MISCPFFLFLFFGGGGGRVLCYSCYMQDIFLTLKQVAGYAVGGGHVLHMVCDLTIAADNAIFGQTGPKVLEFFTFSSFAKLIFIFNI